MNFSLRSPQGPAGSADPSSGVAPAVGLAAGVGVPAVVPELEAPQPEDSSVAAVSESGDAASPSGASAEFASAEQHMMAQHSGEYEFESARRESTAQHAARVRRGGRHSRLTAAAMSRRRKRKQPRNIAPVPRVERKDRWKDAAFVSAMSAPVSLPVAAWFAESGDGLLAVALVVILAVVMAGIGWFASKWLSEPERPSSKTSRAR